MNVVRAENLAKELMEFHNLVGWKFAFNRRKIGLGLCNYTKKTIFLSKSFVQLNEEPIVKNTILHEIAHALVGSGHHHNDVWKRKAIEIGCSGERCTSGVQTAESKYVGVCPNGHTIKRHKKLKAGRKTSCGKCSPKFDERYLIVYSERI